MRFYFKYILILFLTSCVTKNEGYEIKYGLLDSKSEFKIDDGEITNFYNEDRDSVIKPYIYTEYLDNETIIVKTLHRIDCGGKTVAKIETQNDTIKLLTEHVGKLYRCKKYNQFTYKIRLKNIKKYIVIY